MSLVSPVCVRQDLHERHLLRCDFFFRRLSDKKMGDDMFGAAANKPKRMWGGPSKSAVDMIAQVSMREA